MRARKQKLAHRFRSVKGCGRDLWLFSLNRLNWRRYLRDSGTHVDLRPQRKIKGGVSIDVTTKVTRTERTNQEGKKQGFRDSGRKLFESH